MQIQINTDHNIEGQEPLVAWVRGHLETSLARFNSQITRVEVHLSDESGKRSTGGDKKCRMEVRIANHQPLSTSEHADSVDQAVKKTSDKLYRLIETTLGRIHDKAIHHSPEGTSGDSP